VDQPARRAAVVHQGSARGRPEAGAGSTIATGITVFVKKGIDPDALAVTIQKQVPGVRAEGPKAFQETMSSATKLLNAIIFGVALISLLVGGLSVVNRQIVGQFLGESAAIGLLGGLGGLLLGWLTTLALNAAGNQSGTALFLLTTRLAIGSVLFALLLGVVSGLYPSWHAARLNPVAALRYE
jgi:putative ABC transport system permease protein